MHTEEPHQTAARIFAGQCAGEYLDEIRITDLAKLSNEQWDTFLLVMCHNYHQKCAELEPCPF